MLLTLRSEVYVFSTSWASAWVWSLASYFSEGVLSPAGDLYSPPLFALYYFSTPLLPQHTNDGQFFFAAKQLYFSVLNKLFFKPGTDCHFKSCHLPYSKQGYVKKLCCCFCLCSSTVIGKDLFLVQ